MDKVDSEAKLILCSLLASAVFIKKGRIKPLMGRCEHGLRRNLIYVVRHLCVAEPICLSYYI